MGISGSSKNRERLVDRMCGTIAHRGPDDRGSYIDDDIAIGMQRLSIVDIAGGHQPFSTEDGRVQLVFNGEIFNYKEMRQAFISDGASLRTSSDTECILHQYIRRGLDGFHELNGMFAVAIWDRRTRSLHLVRDRMGVKPLYYYWDGRTFAFASEIKAILALPQIQKAVDPRGIWDYLTFRYVPGPGSIWRNIHKVPPGHRLTVTVGSAPRIERWWDIPVPNITRRTGEALDEEFAYLFRDAVKMRMVADVPVGVMLSGGLDSSAVASVAAESHGEAVKTFSVSFLNSPETDERSYARAVAAYLGADHHEIEIGQQEFIDFLPRLVHFADEPMADLASVPLYYVCELARQSVKVVLSGEGADETLAGYDFDQWHARRLEQFPPRRRGPAAFLRELVRPGEARQGGGDLRDDATPPHMTNYMTSAEKETLCGRRLTEADSLDVVRAHLHRAGSRPALDQILYLYCQDWLVEDLLMKADRMSMANALELRTPFLDYRLVEWAARAPVAVKVGSGADGIFETKHVLRRFAAGRLPTEILRRPKQGFPVPVYDWLAGPLRDWARDLVLSPSAKLRQWCDGRQLAGMVDAGTAPDAAMSDRHRLWNLLVLEHWLQAWTVV